MHVLRMRYVTSPEAENANWFDVSYLTRAIVSRTKSPGHTLVTRKTGGAKRIRANMR